VESASQPELTGSPQVNELIRTAHRFMEARDDASALRDAVDQTDRFLAQMQAMYHGQARYRERTPLFVEVAGRLPGHFGGCTEGIGLIRGFLKSHDIYQLIRGVDRVRAAFNGLVDDLEALRREEASWPVLSRSPYVNVLLRMVTAVGRGTMGADALKDALREMIAHHRGFLANVDRMPRTPREAQHYTERREEILACLRDVEACLLDAQLRLDAGRLPLESLQHAAQATDRLVAIQEEFQAAEEALRNRPCFRCGTSNPVTGRHCTRCGGMLPALLIEDDGPVVDLHLGDQVRAAGHVQTEMTQKLAAAVHDVQAHRIDREALRAVLDEVTVRVAVGKREFGGLAMPATLEDAEREALEQTRALMQTGIQEMEEGLLQMRQYLGDRNPVHLERGLESFLHGADKVAAVQAASAQARGV